MLVLAPGRHLTSSSFLAEIVFDVECASISRVSHTGFEVSIHLGTHQ